MCIVYEGWSKTLMRMCTYVQMYVRSLFGYDSVGLYLVLVRAGAQNGYVSFALEKTWSRIHQLQLKDTIHATPRFFNL